MGMPMAKYHFRVLCRKANIPAYTPILPNKVARKKSSPSEIRSAPAFLERALSRHMMKNAVRFTAMKKARMMVSGLIIFIVF